MAMARCRRPAVQSGTIAVARFEILTQHPRRQIYDISSTDGSETSSTPPRDAGAPDAVPRPIRSNGPGPAAGTPPLPVSPGLGGAALSNSNPPSHPGPSPPDSAVERPPTAPLPVYAPAPSTRSRALAAPRLERASTPSRALGPPNPAPRPPPAPHGPSVVARCTSPAAAAPAAESAGRPPTPGVLSDSRGVGPDREHREIQIPRRLDPPAPSSTGTSTVSPSRASVSTRGSRCA